MAAVAAVVFIAVASFWIGPDDPGLVRIPASMVAATAPGQAAILWADPAQEGDRGRFGVSERQQTGPWSAPKVFEGRLRAAAIIGDEMVVLFKQWYSVYREGKRRHGQKWPFKWEPAAAATLDGVVWVLGLGEDRLYCATWRDDAWTEGKPILQAQGRPICVGAFADDGKLWVSVFAYSKETRQADLSLHEWNDGQWRHKSVWSCRRGFLKVLALRSGQRLWKATLRQRLFGGRRLLVSQQEEGRDAAWRPILEIEKARDFTFAMLGQQPTLIVAQRRQVDLRDLAQVPDGPVEIVHRSSRDVVWKQLVWALLTGLLLVMVVLSASRFAEQQEQRDMVLLRERGAQPAGLGRRCVAFVVDYVLAIVAAALVFTLFYGDDASDDSAVVYGLVVVVAACRLVYTTGFEFASGQTPGKKLVGIRVVTTAGTRLSLQAAILRNILRLIDEAFFIGLAAMVSNSRRQRIGDLLAGTIVVRTRPEQPLRSFGGGHGGEGHDEPEEEPAQGPE